MQIDTPRGEPASSASMQIAMQMKSASDLQDLNQKARASANAWQQALSARLWQQQQPIPLRRISRRELLAVLTLPAPHHRDSFSLLCVLSSGRSNADDVKRRPSVFPIIDIRSSGSRAAGEASAFALDPPSAVVLQLRISKAGCEAPTSYHCWLQLLQLVACSAPFSARSDCYRGLGL